MKYLQKGLVLISAGMVIAGLAHAGGMNDVVAHSPDEFDRVGINQSVPRVNKSDVAKSGRPAQKSQMAAQKAEFLRRLFWIALVAR